MKLITLLLLLSTTIFAQNGATLLSFGIEVAPMLHTKEVKNLQKNSLSPNLVISYGDKSLKAIASLGVLSRFGFVSSNKWSYACGYYTINTISSQLVEHGAEIEVGFNHSFGEFENIRLNIGSSVGLMNKGRASKLTLRPLVIGFTYKIPLAKR